MKDPLKDISISITTGTIIKGLVIFLGVWMLWILRDLFLVIITSVVLASAIEPGIKFLGRYHIHRIPAVLFIYFSFVGIFFIILYTFVPPIVREASDITQRLPMIIRSVDKSIFGEEGLLAPVAKELEQSIRPEISPKHQGISEVFNKISGIGGITSPGTFGAVTTVFGGIFSFILIFVFSFYFAMQERGIENFLRIILPFNYESYAIDLWERSKAKIGKWMQGQILLGVLIFILVYLGLTIFGVPYAMSLALLAGVLELIPVFGPIIGAIPAVFIAFTEGGVSLMLIIFAFYVLVQQFESNLIYPLVVRKVVGVPPILVIMALIIGWELAGFLGILIAVPVAAAIMEFIEDVEKRKGIVN